MEEARPPPVSMFLSKAQWDSLRRFYLNTGHKLRILNGLDSYPTPSKVVGVVGMDALTREAARYLNNIFAIWMDRAQEGRLEIQINRTVLDAMGPWESWLSFFRSIGLYVHETHLEPAAQAALCCVEPRRAFRELSERERDQQKRTTSPPPNDEDN